MADHRPILSKSLKLFTGFVFLAYWGTSFGVPIVYTDEALYLKAITGLAHTQVVEGFEGNAWSASRGTILNPKQVPSVSSGGLTWKSNQANGGVSTINIAPQAGSYRFYANPHGNNNTVNWTGCDGAANPPPNSICWQNDGWIVTPTNANGKIYGIGGYIRSTTLGAKVTYILDGVDVTANPNTNRDGQIVAGDGTWTFYGVVDPIGFSTAEVREMAGKARAAQNIFGDSFTLSMTEPVTLNVDGSTNLDGSLAKPDALTDGIMIMRKLANPKWTTAQITQGVVGARATRTPAQIDAYLTTLKNTMMDVNGDGMVDAANDGMLIFRYLFGHTGDALINGLIPASSTRTTATAIETYLASYM